MPTTYPCTFLISVPNNFGQTELASVPKKSVVPPTFTLSWCHPSWAPGWPELIQILSFLQGGTQVHAHLMFYWFILAQSNCSLLWISSSYTQIYPLYKALQCLLFHEPCIVIYLFIMQTFIEHFFLMFTALFKELRIQEWTKKSKLLLSRGIYFSRWRSTNNKQRNKWDNFR